MVARTEQSLEVLLTHMHVARGGIDHKARRMAGRAFPRTGSQTCKDYLPDDGFNRHAINLWGHFTHQAATYWVIKQHVFRWKCRTCQIYSNSSSFGLIRAPRPGMRAAERQIRIQEFIRNQEFIDAAGLAAQLRVSESSIRRDLAELARQGLVQRVHGGAISLLVREESLGMGWAVNRAREEKRRIGKATASLLEDGQTLIMDGGSTVAEVARQLLSHSLQVITNSILIAEIFCNSKCVELTLTGGYLYPRLGVLLGPTCEEMLAGVAADVLVMGTGGITEAGLSNTNTLVVGSERKMIEVSRRVIVVADHSKFGRQAMAHLTSLETVDVIVTDQDVPPRFEKLLEKCGVELVLA